MDDSAAMTLDVETAVRERYAAGAQAAEPSLCCPVTYSIADLSFIPNEILSRDYGCGDPTSYLSPGDTVLDLGSGGGKVCYIASRIVGAGGRVIGVDCNAEMLDLARRHQSEVAERLGYSNVDFRCGRIQDLKLDLDRLSAELKRQPVQSHQDWLRLRSIEQRLRRDEPLVADNSIDCVVSNCVLNLVSPNDRRQLFREVFRVLKRGGSAVISDIVSDEDVPQRMQENSNFWSGCLSGAFREDMFLKAFEEAGFHGIGIVNRQSQPWQTIEGIEFRSITVQAYKGKHGPCIERNQAVIYRGPFRKVQDDDGHTFRRGERIAVCDKTFHLLQREPYRGQFEVVDPIVSIPVEEAAPFHCSRSRRRHPQETKGATYRLTTESGGSCDGPDSDCC